MLRIVSEIPLVEPLNRRDECFAPYIETLNPAPHTLQLYSKFAICCVLNGHLVAGFAFSLGLPLGFAGGKLQGRFLCRTLGSKVSLLRALGTIRLALTFLPLRRISCLLDNTPDGLRIKLS